MTSFLHKATLRLSCSLYQLVLRAYPRQFRDRYGVEMSQAFAGQLRQTLDSEGFPGFARFAGRMAWDIPTSIARERINLQLLPSLVCAGAAVGLGIYAAHVDRHNKSEACPTLLVVGAGAFMMGLLRPIGAWRWAIIIAAGVPFAGALSSLPHRLATPGSWAMLAVACVPGLIGAYCGFTIRRVAQTAH